MKLKLFLEYLYKRAQYGTPWVDATNKGLFWELQIGEKNFFYTQNPKNNSAYAKRARDGGKHTDTVWAVTTMQGKRVWLGLCDKKEGVKVFGGLGNAWKVPITHNQEEQIEMFMKRCEITGIAQKDSTNVQQELL